MGGVSTHGAEDPCDGCWSIVCPDEVTSDWLFEQRSSSGSPMSVVLNSLNSPLPSVESLGKALHQIPDESVMAGELERRIVDLVPFLLCQHPTSTRYRIEVYDVKIHVRATESYVSHNSPKFMPREATNSPLMPHNRQPIGVSQILTHPTALLVRSAGPPSPQGRPGKIFLIIHFHNRNPR